MSTWAPAAPTAGGRRGVVPVLLSWVLSDRLLGLVASGLGAIVVANLATVLARRGIPSPTMLVAGALLAAVVLRPDARSFAPPPVAVLGIGAYVAVTALSVTWAGDAELAVAATILLAKDVAVALLVAGVVRRTGSLRALCWAVVAATTFVAAVTVWQAATGTYGQPYGGLALSDVGNIVVDHDSWRQTGTFGDANFFAQGLLVGVAFALARLRYERDVVLRTAAAVAVALLSTAVVLTYSRGGGLVLVVLLVGAGLLLWRPRPRTVVTVAVPLLVVAVVALPPGYSERLAVVSGSVADASAPGADVSVRGRVSEVRAGLLMFRDRPLLGVGAGNYPARYQEYARGMGLDPRREPRAAHSLYVEVLAETGVVGAVTLAGVLSLAFARLGVWPFASAADRRRTDRRSREAGLAAATVAFLLTSVLLHGAFLRILWLLVALAATTPRGPVPDRRRLVQVPTPAVPPRGWGRPDGDEGPR
jgi:putative inorganic carbon (hco3(-)) transporter